MHALEKILARVSGEVAVEAGQIVNARVELAEVNDLYLQVLVSFEEMKARSVWDPSRVVFVLDHYAPAPTILAATNQKKMRDFCAAHHVKYLFDVNSGICHQVMVEAGLVKPGMLVVETDSHTTTLGALGAFGTGCGATDMAAILATGEMWMRVPEIIRVNYEGRLPEDIMGKDLALRTIGEFGTEVAGYKGIEYAGEAVSGLSLANKMALCNMAVEMGAKTSYIEPTPDVLDYVRQRSGEETRPVQTDPGYEYHAEYRVWVEDMEPQVACPSRVDNVHGVSEVAGERVDQAVIGTCTGGRLEDIGVAARLLAGKRVSPSCRLIIAPASAEILRKAIDLGYIQTLLDAGATVVPAGCGPCLGAHQGVLAPGERCITASSRNFPGRMGSPEAEIFVASPATVAASAIAGRIADPRKVR
ncbi:MAG: 3-isopropylmalate dehydratase large subunit [Bacillota bacterium]